MRHIECFVLYWGKEEAVKCHWVRKPHILAFCLPTSFQCPVVWLAPLMWSVLPCSAAWGQSAGIQLCGGAAPASDCPARIRPWVRLQGFLLPDGPWQRRNVQGKALCEWGRQVQCVPPVMCAAPWGRHSVSTWRWCSMWSHIKPQSVKRAITLFHLYGHFSWMLKRGKLHKINVLLMHVTL